ncbi:MAG: hypothetical protein PUE08_04065 [Eubacteriales bacterium]|nr:hypothetical protein [Eubacteriales bacterium]
MKNNSHKNASILAVCSISTALSVVLLFLGGITFVLAYAMPMLVGLLMIMLKTTFGTKSAWITYTAVALLSFMLVTDKECMLMYVMLFGCYPMIRDAIERLKNKPIKILLKFLFFNIMLTLCQLALVYIFGIPFLSEGEGKYFIIVFAVLMNFLFIIYDKMIDAVTKLYKIKIEKRIKKLFK